MLNSNDTPLRTARCRLGLSLRVAAELAGGRISHQTVSNWERGKTKPLSGTHIGAALRLARAYYAAAVQAAEADPNWQYPLADFTAEALWT